MPSNFFRSLLGTVFLGILVVLTAINVWQSNRIERNQIDLGDRVAEIEKAIENGTIASSSGNSNGGGPTGGIWGTPEPDYITVALQDPNNKLTRETTSQKCTITISC